MLALIYLICDLQLFLFFSGEDNSIDTGARHISHDIFPCVTLSPHTGGQITWLPSRKTGIICQHNLRNKLIKDLGVNSINLNTWACTYVNLSYVMLSTTKFILPQKKNSKEEI